MKKRFESITATLLVVLLATVMLTGCTGSSAPTPTEELFSALRQNDEVAVANLISSGVDVNATSPGGRSPLLQALPINNINIIRMLLDAGADPTQTGADGITHGSWGLLTFNLEVVQLLEDHGVNWYQSDIRMFMMILDDMSNPPISEYEIERILDVVVSSPRLQT